MESAPECLPHGRHQGGDRHLNFYDVRDNLGLVARAEDTEAGRAPAPVTPKPPRPAPLSGAGDSFDIDKRRSPTRGALAPARAVRQGRARAAEGETPSANRVVTTINDSG
jgi:hypothetical protein